MWCVGSGDWMSKQANFCNPASSHGVPLRNAHILVSIMYQDGSLTKIPLISTVKLQSEVLKLCIFSPFTPSIIPGCKCFRVSCLGVCSHRAALCGMVPWQHTASGALGGWQAYVGLRTLEWTLRTCIYMVGSKCFSCQQVALSSDCALLRIVHDAINTYLILTKEGTCATHSNEEELVVLQEGRRTDPHSAPFPSFSGI